MKKTLLFSNIKAKEDIFETNGSECEFNQPMQEYLKKNNIAKNLLFVSAPGLGGEENYLSVILKCFSKISINFENIIEVNFNTKKQDIKNFISKHNDMVIFLMGGNPISQFELIKKFNILRFIKNYDGLVIGFCAGAINLSKKSIITTDEDFTKPLLYDAIKRVPLIIEPHYNINKMSKNFAVKRNAELQHFSEILNEKIIALPDSSIIVVEGEKITTFGKIFEIENN